MKKNSPSLKGTSLQMSASNSQRVTFGGGGGGGGDVFNANKKKNSIMLISARVHSVALLINRETSIVFSRYMMTSPEEKESETLLDLPLEACRVSAIVMVFAEDAQEGDATKKRVLAYHPSSSKTSSVVTISLNENSITKTSFPSLLEVTSGDHDDEVEENPTAVKMGIMMYTNTLQLMFSVEDLKKGLMKFPSSVLCLVFQIVVDQSAFFDMEEEGDDQNFFFSDMDSVAPRVLAVGTLPISSVLGPITILDLFPLSSIKKLNVKPLGALRVTVSLINFTLEFLQNISELCRRKDLQQPSSSVSVSVSTTRRQPPPPLPSVVSTTRRQPPPPSLSVVSTTQPDVAIADEDSLLPISSFPLSDGDGGGVGFVEAGDVSKYSSSSEEINNETPPFNESRNVTFSGVELEYPNVDDDDDSDVSMMQREKQLLAVDDEVMYIFDSQGRWFVTFCIGVEKIFTFLEANQRDRSLQFVFPMFLKFLSKSIELPMHHLCVHSVHVIKNVPTVKIELSIQSKTAYLSHAPSPPLPNLPTTTTTTPTTTSSTFLYVTAIKPVPTEHVVRSSSSSSSSSHSSSSFDPQPTATSSSSSNDSSCSSCPFLLEVERIRKTLIGSFIARLLQKVGLRVTKVYIHPGRPTHVSMEALNITEVYSIVLESFEIILEIARRRRSRRHVFVSQELREDCIGGGGFSNESAAVSNAKQAASTGTPFHRGDTVDELRDLVKSTMISPKGGEAKLCEPVGSQSRLIGKHDSCEESNGEGIRISIGEGGKGMSSSILNRCRLVTEEFIKFPQPQYVFDTTKAVTQKQILNRHGPQFVIKAGKTRHQFLLMPRTVADVPTRIDKKKDGRRTRQELLSTHKLALYLRRFGFIIDFNKTLSESSWELLWSSPVDDAAASGKSMERLWASKKPRETFKKVKTLSSSDMCVVDLIDLEESFYILKTIRISKLRDMSQFLLEFLQIITCHKKKQQQKQQKQQQPSSSSSSSSSQSQSLTSSPQLLENQPPHHHHPSMNLQHPSTVQVLAIYRDALHIHLLLQYMPNGNLRKLLTSFLRFPEHIVRTWTVELVVALLYIHSSCEGKMIHGEICPDRIYLDEEGHLKLAPPSTVRWARVVEGGRRRGFSMRTGGWSPPLPLSYLPPESLVPPPLPRECKEKLQSSSSSSRSSFENDDNDDGDINEEDEEEFEDDAAATVSESAMVFGSTVDEEDEVHFAFPRRSLQQQQQHQHQRCLRVYSAPPKNLYKGGRREEEGKIIHRRKERGTKFTFDRQPWMLGYSQASDVWCFGVLIFQLLTGVPPFIASSPEGLLCIMRTPGKIGNVLLTMKNASWECRDFLASALKVNPTQRGTVLALSKHAWLLM